MVPPGKLIPATFIRAIVKVAIPAAKGQYWNETRLIPIFGKGYGVKTLRASIAVSMES